MIRKIIALTLSVALLCTTAAFASPEVGLKDAEKDIIRVTTSAQKGEALTVLIINPGYEKEEVYDNGDAIAYYTKTVADADNFALDIGMFDSARLGGGEYTVIVSRAGGYEEASFRFFFTEEKLRVIDVINGAENAALVVDKLYETYSLADSKVFETTDKAVLADILSKSVPFEKNVQTMHKSLGDALCLAAYCDGNENLISSGTIMFSDVLGVSDTPLYEDYLECLSEDGKAKVNRELLGNDYRSIGDIEEKFTELVLVHLITDYEYMGFGHVSEFLEKYKSEYKLAGIDAEKIQKSKKANTVYQAMQTSKAKTLADLKKIVSSNLKSSDESSGGGGGGGGGSVSESDKAPDVIGAPVGGVTEEEAVVPNLETPFTDLEDAQWAKEYIGALYRIGAISGKTPNTFAPSDNITRAEFTKILITALFGTPQNGKIIFQDAKGWEAPYVAYGVENGIINGISDTLFAPSNNITREQASTIVARALKTKGYVSEKKGKKFADDSQISDWAKDSVDILSGSGIISGRGSNSFCPTENMTRAEAAKIISASMKLIEGAK